MMPYPNYNRLTEEDINSIVAYVRSLQPIKNTLPETELNFPLNFIVKTMPIKSRNPMKFDPSDSLEYGKYLTTIASCGGCHTKSEKGEPIAGMEYAGGEEFKFPGGIARSLNITPDKVTGIGLWTKELFIKRFKAYTTESSKVIPVSENDFNTPMPWLMYAGMTEEDLGAIYDYLRTVKPVGNKVQSFSKLDAARK
jgi:mono/diheme cytochrome c family protein